MLISNILASHKADKADEPDKVVIIKRPRYSQAAKVEAAFMRENGASMADISEKLSTSYDSAVRFCIEILGKVRAKELSVAAIAKNKKERKLKIAELIEGNPKLTPLELSKILKVSVVTARNNLKEIRAESNDGKND
jgi:predicted ArsR family transcriptional regulator